MSAFTVRGKFQSRDGWQQFETSIEAENENVAREHTLSQLGSQHGLKRTEIKLDEVSEQ